MELSQLRSRIPTLQIQLRLSDRFEVMPLFVDNYKVGSIFTDWEPYLVNPVAFTFVVGPSHLSLH